MRILCSLVLMLMGLSWHGLAEAACDQTISVGANVSNTVVAATAGTTICMNSGSYGQIDFASFTKSPRVTLQSTTGQGASMGFRLRNSNNGLTINSVTISTDNDMSGSNTKNITIQNSAIGAHQIDVDTTNFNNNNILIDHNTFGAYTPIPVVFEGRLEIHWGGGPGTVPAGVVVTNNTFGPGGCSDGIQIGSYGVVVGPGNIFTGIVQSPGGVDCNGTNGAHVDAIQGYGSSHTTINGNFFTGNMIDLGFYDGENTATITNNIFEPGESQINLSLFGFQGLSFAHNTIRSRQVGLGAKGAPASSGHIMQNNILIDTTFVNVEALPGCGSDCIVRFNLKDATSSTSPTGTNNISGSPTFLGGSSPSTWAGYQLTGGSLGKNAGNDGLDMGTTYYGSAVVSNAASATGGVRLTGGAKF